MKCRWIFFLCMMGWMHADAQYSKYIIQFTDKKNSPFSLQQPSAYLSSKAILRRTKYNIATDSTDLPVNPAYINQVKTYTSVTYLSQSKWLNQILILCTDQNSLNQIKALPFVKKAQGIGNRLAGNGRTKDKLKLKQTAAVARIEGQQGNVYDYGSALAQIRIHEGEFLHNKGLSGQGMIIAVLDGGFNNYKTISAFDSIRINQQVLGERDFVAFDNSVNEDHPHGMECLSILAGNWPGKLVGSAPKSSYWLIRTENAATEFPIEEHNWVVGAEFADSSGADMISSSLGYNTFDDPSFDHTYNEFYKNTAISTQGAALAVRKGMIVVNAAGNEGNNSWKYLTLPSDADSVCAVGAVNAQGVIANFSSLGFPGKIKPNVVSLGAPAIVAGSNGIVSASGTSYSTPNIAGLIACLWQAFPQFNNMQVLDAVYKSADHYTNPDNRYGFGIPNMHKAYQLLKHQQNILLYGNAWLFATPASFTDTIHVKFISQLDGNVTIDLLDKNNTVILSKTVVAEKEETYQLDFTPLAFLPAGNYLIRYNDGQQTNLVQVSKLSLGSDADWLTAYPMPFHQTTTIYLRAPETSVAHLTLTDLSGKILETKTFSIVKDSVYQPKLNSFNIISSGIYFLLYEGSIFKRTLKIIRQ
ncbi:MAG: family serine peptidase [Chitinophagaceae bacterium]|nr:family serine peptidase [Chitinophagaceae bacterium]